MMPKALLAMACIAAAGACAKPYGPPGGKQDRTPPRLVTTAPAALAVVQRLDGPIVFEFDETLAERGINEAAVSVSPQPRGRVHVERKGNRIEVTTDGGWATNQVYRVVVQPGVGDRFGNARKEPVEVIFSTGPPIQNTALAGLIMDRLTGRRALNGAIEAIRRGDSAVYMVPGDTSGFFALRYLPAGVYDVVAFGDQNSNRRRDPSEPFSPARQVSLGATDTATVELVILPADTTGPKLVRATLMDSLHVTLTFDDAIDVDGGLAAATTEFLRASDNAPIPGGRFQQLKNIYQRTAPPPAARPGGVASDTTARDSAAARVDSMRAAAAEAAARRPGAQRDTTSLPDREVVLTLTVPLEPGTKYRITATGFKNVNGLLGGGSAEFDTPRRAPAPAPGRSGGDPRERPRQARTR